MVVIPVSFFLLIIHLLDNILLPEEFMSMVMFWLAIPFCVYYMVAILILDKTHVEVKESNPHPPRFALEHASSAFLKSTLNYFPLSCVPWEETAKLPISRQYIFAVHPHGIHCFPLGLLSTVGSDFDKKFPGLVGSKLTGLAATVMFKLPVVRELFLCMGYIDASRPVASKCLEVGRSIFVCTGGEEESMFTSTGKDIVVLKKRKGFVRLALSYGADIVPVYGVGNTDLYTTYNFIFLGFRHWLQKTCGIALPIFHGRFGTPLPYKKAVQVLIGKPIRTPKPSVIGERPDPALVDEYHSKYIEALRQLHSKNVKHRVLEIL